MSTKHGARRRSRTQRQKQDALSHRGPRRIVNYPGAYYTDDPEDPTYFLICAPMHLGDDEDVDDLHPLELLERCWADLCRVFSTKQRENRQLRIVEVIIPATFEQLRRILLLPRTSNDVLDDQLGHQWPVRISTIPIHYVERVQGRDLMLQLLVSTKPQVIPVAPEGAALHTLPTDEKTH